MRWILGSAARILYEMRRKQGRVNPVIAGKIWEETLEEVNDEITRIWPDATYERKANE